MSGYLVLETGEVFSGNWLGGEPRAAEVVFNTSHSGYEEIATDPSYYKQMVVMTSPMQGNYGVCDDHWESHRIWIEGFMCLQMQNTSSDSKWLKKLLSKGIPVVSELDTRKITLRLRSGGTPWGALVSSSNEAEAKKLAYDLIEKSKSQPKDWVWDVSLREAQLQVGKNPKGPKIAVIDLGCKRNILQELLQRSSEIKVFPSRAEFKDIEAYRPDGIMLTNGPGDPLDVEKSVETIKKFLELKPIFGICMGHQLLCLALGAKTYKLKFGHRGANHPIADSLLDAIYVTSQNHGYAVDESTIPKEVQITHRNLNDHTVAGIYSARFKCLGIQYHPESHPGPHDAVKLFDFFIEKMLR